MGWAERLNLSNQFQTKRVITTFSLSKVFHWSTSRIQNILTLKFLESNFRKVRQTNNNPLKIKNIITCLHTLLNHFYKVAVVFLLTAASTKKYDSGSINLMKKILASVTIFLFKTVKWNTVIDDCRNILFLKFNLL